jgi:CHAT domain-containing protein
MSFETRAACLSSEVLGAFAEGLLGAEERDAVIAHLDSCARCRDEVAVLGAFVDERAAPARRRLPAWWAAAAAIAIVLAGTAVFWSSYPRRDTAPVAPLIAASAALDHRLVEPRLHGFGWAAYRGVVRATQESDRSPERLKVLGAAGEVLEHARGSETAEAAHAAGVASLLIDDPAAAVERLEAAAAKQPQEATVWSDLAAAHYELAIRLGRASHLPEALAAADRALKLDPRLPEALFNRALVLERLGLTGDARAAWKRYLEIDPSSAWAVEARRRLAAFSSSTAPAPAFGKALETAAPEQLVAAFPQQARAFAEVELLDRWAKAFLAGDGGAAAPLATARGIGAALQRRSGESLLAEAVRAIDEAGGEDRMRLAEAHLAYRSGRFALSRQDVQTARRLLERAASLFGDSPAALNARHYAAVAEYEAGRTAVAGQELAALADELRQRPAFKALRAQTAWQQGLVAGAQMRWPAALADYATARALFGELGEASNAAFVDVLIGEAAILLGRRDEAWGGWTRALRALSEHGLHDRLLVTLGAISRTESMAGHDGSAAAFLDLEIEHANDDDRLRADALSRRAFVSARMRDTAAARKAVEEGARAAQRITDAAARQQAVADLQLAEGMVSGDDPVRALALLTGAVEHYRAARPVLLPVALYERARVLRALGRVEEATEDLRAAAEGVETQRGEVEWRELRAAAVDGVAAIYRSLGEVLLERGQTREAFTVADRAAAHAFLGAAAARSAVTVEALQQSLGDDAVVEYLTLPRELVIFAVTARQFAVERVPADDLPRRVAALNDAIRRRGDVRAASLYATLIAPVEPLLAGAGTITFVADATVEPVPFSALFDPASGRWLIEKHAVRRAAAALTAGSEPPRQNRARIVVIQPEAADLPNAAAEAAAIAALYRDSLVLGGERPAAVLAAMESAAIIHYAGHTNSGGESGLALGRTVLYGTDVARLHLRAAPLVVLAGCRTMRGAAYRDDVTTSLTRAFLLAGARAVIGTAWDLDDRAAAALFERMHAAYAVSGDAVAALRQAQLAALSDSACPPAEWAAAEIIVRSAFTKRGTS